MTSIVMACSMHRCIVAAVVNRGTLLVGGAKSSHWKEWHVGPQARRGWNYAGTARPFGLMLWIFPNGRG